MNANVSKRTVQPSLVVNASPRVAADGWRLDGVRVGTTPCEIPFEHYGVRRVGRCEGVEEHYLAIGSEKKVGGIAFGHVYDVVSATHDEIRVRNPKKKGIYLSAVRSFVFNEVLALRIQQGLWGKTLPGDVMDEAGLPTGPLWGRGRVTTTDQAQALENGVAERHATLCDGMEHAGLDQERRGLVASPADLSWEWPQADQLVLTFSLPAGNYATSVLNEILRTTEPERHTEGESAAVE